MQNFAVEKLNIGQQSIVNGVEKQRLHLTDPLFKANGEGTMGRAVPLGVDLCEATHVNAALRFMLVESSTLGGIFEQMAGMLALAQHDTSKVITV